MSDAASILTIIGTAIATGLLCGYVYTQWWR